MAKDQMPPVKPKSHKVNPAALIKYKAMKGWTDEDLAEQAEVSERTLERVWAGVPISMRSIDHLAAAFGITCDKLLLFEEQQGFIYPAWGPPLPVSLNRDDFFPVKLTVGIPFDEFNQSERMLTFIAILKKMVGIKEEIQFGVERGSTIVTLTVNTQDTLRLLAEMMDGTLRNINIISINIPDEMYLVRALATIKILGTPVVPEADAWSELLNAKLVEEVIGRWSSKLA